MPTARSGPPAFRGRPVYRGYVERPNASGIVGTATTLHATRLVGLAIRRHLDVAARPHGALVIIRTHRGQWSHRITLEPYSESQPRHVTAAGERDGRVLALATLSAIRVGRPSGRTEDRNP
ncbi:hypothetical protein ACIOGZ_28445 [Kitasatospora sp. NPDC088160]|uniref:hypothetical protein n=1 Tax=Kitasatospora sp. NPDC088160 TaxID=3364072 RepID=UPI003805EE47